jgi:hypothetical protein
LTRSQAFLSGFNAVLVQVEALEGIQPNLVLLSTPLSILAAFTIYKDQPLPLDTIRLLLTCRFRFCRLINFETGDYALRRSLLSHVRELLRVRKLGEDHPETLSLVSILAIHYGEAGR